MIIVPLEVLSVFLRYIDRNLRSNLEKGDSPQFHINDTRETRLNMKFRTVRIKISRGWSYALYSVSFLVLSFLSAHAGTLNDSFRSKVVISGVKPQAGDTINGWVYDSDWPLLFTNVVQRTVSYHMLSLTERAIFPLRSLIRKTAFRFHMWVMTWPSARLTVTCL